MDHSYIDEHNVIAQYGMGKLSPAECVRFEEHFVDCPQCQKQLETAMDFRQALTTVAAEDAARSQFGTTSSPPFSPAAQSWKPALMAVAACLVILAVPAFLLVRQARLAHSELDQAKAAAETWHRQYVDEQQATAELEKQLRDAGQKGQPNQTASGAAQLPVVASIFTLETVRGGELPGSEPVNYVVISHAPQWIVLSVDLNDMQALKNYSATLAESNGKVLWQQGHLVPASSNALGISLPSSLLREGDFVLTLRGRSRSGGNVTSRSYPFRVKLK